MSQIWTPPGFSQDADANRNADVEREAGAIAAWCRSWPKRAVTVAGRHGAPDVVVPAEAPLGGGDVADVVLARARQYLWERSFSEAVMRRTMELLELVRSKPVAVPSKAPTGSQRRRERREGRVELTLAEKQRMEAEGERALSREIEVPRWHDPQADGQETSRIGRSVVGSRPAAVEGQQG